MPLHEQQLNRPNCHYVLVIFLSRTGGMAQKEGSLCRPHEGNDDLNHVREILDKYRLGLFFTGFVTLGVTKLEDFTDVGLDDLHSLGKFANSKSKNSSQDFCVD